MFPENEQLKPTVVDEEKEEVPVATKPRKRKKKKTIPLSAVDSQVAKKEEPKVSTKKEVSVPDLDVTFPAGTEVVDTALIKLMFRDTNARLHGVSETVAYIGRGVRQRVFGLELASWRVIKGGTLYVPESLANVELLKTWEQLDKAPKGFVAFKAK